MKADKIHILILLALVAIAYLVYHRCGRNEKFTNKEPLSEVCLEQCDTNCDRDFRGDFQKTLACGHGCVSRCNATPYETCVETCVDNCTADFAGDSNKIIACGTSCQTTVCSS